MKLSTRIRYLSGACMCALASIRIDISGACPWLASVIALVAVAGFAAATWRKGK